MFKICAELAHLLTSSSSTGSLVFIFILGFLLRLVLLLVLLRWSRCWGFLLVPLALFRLLRCYPRLLRATLRRPLRRRRFWRKLALRTPSLRTGLVARSAGVVWREVRAGGEGGHPAAGHEAAEHVGATRVPLVAH